MEEIIHVSSESNQTSSLTDYTESVVNASTAFLRSLNH